MTTKTKILLVEDDPFLGDLILSDLSILFPYNQIEILGPVGSFSDAVALLQRELPTIALLDIELGEDRNAGIRLAQHINLTRPIPVVFLSGLPRSEGFDVAKLTAPYGYISKPYQRQQLGDTLELLLVRESQRLLSGIVSGNGKSLRPSSNAIFVTTAYGELTPLPLDKLVVLEADGKIIRAYLSDQEKPVVFTSPGLKNFFQDHQSELKADFFQLSRKYIISISKIAQIKDNHVKLPRCVSGSADPFFLLTIPVNGESKKLLLNRLIH